MTEELVIVGEALGDLQAQILKGLLESEEIPVLLSQESAGKVYGLTIPEMGIVKILVRAQDAARAEQLLQEYEAGRLTTEDLPEMDVPADEESDQ